jgi:5-methylcytosine-specific restriction protein B
MKEVYEIDHDPINDALACYEFASEIRPGDLVFAKRGRGRIIGYGIVLGDYAFNAERPHFKNYRRIRWDGRGDWEVERQLPTKSLTNITDDKEHVEKLKRLVGLFQNQDAPEVIPVGEREPFTIQNALDGLFMSQDEFEKILRIWKAKKNLILQGSPGVGKTYIARRLAYALLQYKDPSRVGMVQFHQSYSYEDFVQGYRPSGTGLQLRDGIFMEFCAKAARDPDTDHVFIIDEINRGNLSRIFGELMMLLEPDKRGSNWSVPLTYATSSENQFSVPKNVYLLGLMNTADRSLAMVDYALRRRFAFWTLEPQIKAPAFRAMLETHGIAPDRVTRLITILGEINEDIAADTANLGPGYRIGHSFFCQEIGDDGESSVWLADVIETELIPLLNEYWVDNSTKAGRWADQLRSVI